MNVFEFLLFSLFIVLVQGQSVVNRRPLFRHRAQQVRRMSSVIRRINGQASVNINRNLRPRDYSLQQLVSNDIQNASQAEQAPANRSENGEPQAQEMLHPTASYAIQNASEEEQASVSDSQNGQGAEELLEIAADAIQNGSLEQEQAAVNRSQDWQQRISDIHQHHRQNGSSSSLAENGGDFQPESWHDLFAMNNVTNITGFLSILTRDGQPVRMDELFEPSENNDGKVVIAGSGDQLAFSDECSPRNTTVRLRLENSDPSVVFYPECTRIERCGGCTPAPYLACVPSYKEMVVLTVLKARYPRPGALSVQMEGFAHIRVERHLRCHTVCTLTAQDCGPNSQFHPELCRCRCNGYSQCGSGKDWDEVRCQCKCRQEAQCCRHEKDQGYEGMCTMFFDHDICECTLKESVGANPNASQAEIEAWLASRRSRRPDHFSQTNGIPRVPVTTITTPTTPAPTITTPTTPSSTTTRGASCAHLICPRNMIRAMTPSGRCLCQRPRRG